MPPASTTDHLQRLAGALRQHREANALSLGALGRRTGLSKTSLMRLETGHANPSLETLWRIGHELGLTIAQLIEQPDPDGETVQNADAGTTITSEAGMQGRLLAHDPTAHRTEVFELILPAWARFTAEPHDRGTRELVYCVSGTVRCGSTDDPLALTAGDSAEFDGDRAHHYATGPDGGRAVLVMSYPTIPAA